MTTKLSNQVLFVTSFAKDMWESSGKKLLKTFKKYQPNHQLLVCYEKFDFQDDDPRILKHNLDQNPFLREWLSNNSDVIPVYLGGKATPENNPDLFKSYWNRVASRWFRKVVSMKYARDHYSTQFQSIFWVDSDCYFQKTLEDSTFKKVFGSSNVIYHLGPKRRMANLGVESGLIGFQGSGGYQFLDLVAHKFRSGLFRKYHKWDDGFVFRKVIEEILSLNLKLPKNKQIICSDLVKDLNPKKQERSQVITYGPFKDFLIHEKGKHKKSKVLD